MTRVHGIPLLYYYQYYHHNALIIAGDVIGVAQLCNKLNGLKFTSFDENIAQAFSVYCCISIMHVSFNIIISINIIIIVLVVIINQPLLSLINHQRHHFTQSIIISTIIIISLTLLKFLRSSCGLFETKHEKIISFLGIWHK